MRRTQEEEEEPSRLRGDSAAKLARRARAEAAEADFNDDPHEYHHDGRDGLPEMPEALVKKDQGATALCLASMGLHLEALDKFLQTEGVDASAHMPRDGDRTALHCAGSVWVYGDSLRESYIFSLLQHTPHWLEKVMDPVPIKDLASYGMWDVTHGARVAIGLVVKRLLEAGANPNAKDDGGKTPLHYAAVGGLETMAAELLAAGADPNVVEKDYLQTPLHLCATHGHANIAKLMLDKGADPHARDAWGNSFTDIATAVGGAISAAALKEHLGMDKVPQVVRPPASASASLDQHGHGGWSEESLPPPFAFPEEDAARAAAGAAGAAGGEAPLERCDVDMLDASAVTAEEVYHKYIMMNRPVLLRGLNADSPAWRAYEREELKHAHGSLDVHVSDIPYNQKFGSPNGRDENLGAYIDEIATHRLGDHPWYVFKGHPVPRESSSTHSLVPIDTVPIPRLMYEIFAPMAAKDRPRASDITAGLFKALAGGGDADETARATQEKRREPFVNMQWALGTKGSGAPVHFHNTAWNQLFYGKKHWYLLPPGRNLMGKKQVLKWVEEDVAGLKAQGYEFFECVQQQGDVLIVPELWGHAVLNTQDAVAVASEVKGSNYRLKLPRAYHDLSRHMGLAAGVVEGGGDPRRNSRSRPPHKRPDGGNHDLHEPLHEHGEGSEAHRRPPHKPSLAERHQERIRVLAEMRARGGD